MAGMGLVLFRSQVKATTGDRVPPAETPEDDRFEDRGQFFLS